MRMCVRSTSRPEKAMSRCFPSDQRPLDDAARDRRVLVHATERREHRLERGHDAPAERAVRACAPSGRSCRLQAWARTAWKPIAPCTKPASQQVRCERCACAAAAVDVADEQPATAAVAASSPACTAPRRRRAPSTTARARPRAGTPSPDDRRGRRTRRDARSRGSPSRRPSASDRALRPRRRPACGQRRSAPYGLAGSVAADARPARSRAPRRDRAQQIERRRHRELHRAESGDEQAATHPAAVLHRLQHVVHRGRSRP